MKRLIIADLIKWKQKDKPKPLILRGARQVGKSYTVLEFGREHFKNVVVVNFEKQSSLGEIFSGDIDVKDIIARLEMALDTRILPQDTLLFFDEIQSCPRALSALRYFKEDAPEYRVIAAGSLLDFALTEISFPVGRVSWLTLYPMTFLEFLWALGESSLAKLVREEPRRIDDVLHRKLLGMVKKYGIVGGMPEAVAEYIGSRSYLECQEVHRELVDTYRRDFAKYAPKARVPQLLKVIEQIPKHVGQQIKYTTLDRDSRTEETKAAVSLLERARVIHRVAATSGHGLPLGAEASDKIFKEIFLDVGLMQTVCGINWKDIPDAGDFVAINDGALAEQFTGQELLALQADADELFYWRREERGSQAEVDFVIARNGGVAPIEVKSGARGHLKSLALFRETYRPQEMFVVSSRSYAVEDGMTFVPLYFLAGLVGHRGT